MKTIRASKASGGVRRDSGQVTIFVTLALGIFLLGAMGFAVDMSNLWFHRQSAQTAADAACIAGAMDLLVDATNGRTTQGGFTAGTSFDCSGATGVAPCQYAALNGYNASLAKDSPASSLGNEVYASFPTSVSGVTPPAATLAPTPFIRVDVVDHAQIFFSALLSGNKSQPVRASAVCGLVQAKAPIPLIVLKPNCAGTLGLSGSGTVAIIGGPSRSIQVNSNNSAAVSNGGSSATINLSRGGTLFTGSDLGTFGGPSTAVTGFSAGSTGRWLYPASPIDDPYAQVVAPNPPTIVNPLPTFALYNTHGCPDQTGNNANNGRPLDSTGGCVEYHPGLYTAPIVVKNYTAIFEPGLYYFNIPVGSYDSEQCGKADGVCILNPTGGCNNALAVDSKGILRLSTDTGDGSHGVTFYLSGPGVAGGGSGGYGSVFFGANAGSTGGSRTVDPFSTTPTDGTGAICSGGAAVNSNLNLPASIGGNVLLGPCTYDGTYLTSATNRDDGTHVPKVRGMIFFQDRANGDSHGQPSMQGGGGLLISGTMYFHNCPASPSCNPSTDYKAFLQFQGGSGSSTFMLGNITTDELLTGGGGSVAMQLNPASVYNLLKVSLLK